MTRTRLQITKAGDILDADTGHQYGTVTEVPTDDGGHVYVAKTPVGIQARGWSALSASYRLLEVL